ncbi:FAD-dependent oxidoreductase [Myceligenerans halotolerans]
MNDDARPRPVPQAGVRPDRPVIVVVDDDPQVLRAVRRDLRGRYGRTYRIVAASSGAEACAVVAEYTDSDEDIAMLLSDQRMPDMPGVEFLQRTRRQAPDAKRVLLTAYADTDAAIKAINDVRLDYYIVKPWDPPEEKLFPVLDDLLDDWATRNRASVDGIEVIGTAVSPATHRIKDFLMRNERPFHFFDVERDAHARRVLAAHAGAELPLVVLASGAILQSPGNAELAEGTGLTTTATRPHYDTVIIGAGPAGLGAAVYAASEGLSALLIDRDSPGGQAGTSSRIENYLGFPSGVSGADLTRRALAQARRFGAEVLNPVAATGLRTTGTTRIVTLDNGAEISAESVLLTTGVQYNRLDVPGSERFEGAGLFYGAATTESMNCRDTDVFVVGGANSAGQAAMHFAHFARRVTILIRSDDIEKGMSQYLVDEIAATPSIEVRTGTVITAMHGDDLLEAITVRDRDGTETTLPTQFVFTFIGARPRTDWLDGVVQRDARGFVLTGADVAWSSHRQPMPLETSVPGVFAAGDIRAQSVKRVASGVGEGALAVAMVHRYRALN